MTNLTINLKTEELARILGTVLESICEDGGRPNAYLGPLDRNTAWVCVRGRKDGDVVFEINSAGVAIVYVYAEDYSFDTHVLGKLTLRNVEAKALEIYRIATATR
jgi:hypothetical protein